MEGKVTINPLQVSDVEKFGDQCLGPVGPVEIAAGGSQVVMLDEVKVCGDTSFHEIPPSDFVVADGECSHSW